MIPELDTTKVQNMRTMCANCPKLVTVPIFNVPNLTTIEDVFYKSPSLSDESLNNILAMCISAVKITSTGMKKLSFVGLNEEQATRCQSLSNYQAFLDAGWITGY